MCDFVRTRVFLKTFNSDLESSDLILSLTDDSKIVMSSKKKVVTPY